MKLLIDTNIIVPLEPGLTTDFEINTDHALEFHRLAQKSGNTLHIHPAIEHDLLRDKITERANLRQKLINRYDKILYPPSLSLLEKTQVGDPKKGSNDYVDNCLLAAVKGDAVDFLITEDKGIHRKARRIDLDSRVFFLQEAIALLLDFFDKSPPPPPSVKKVYVYELNERDTIFNSLRSDYHPGFDEWLRYCKRTHREAYVIPNEETTCLSGICIIKSEEILPTGDSGRTLKLCTFKVSDFEHGKRFGELLLKAVFDYADENNYDFIYFTAFPKQDELIAFSESFGFHVYEEQNDRGEYIVYKKLVYQMEDIENLSPLEFHINYGPRRVIFNNNTTFIVPIKPIYHKVLFPELEPQIPIFHESRPCGNSIKKAYLCHSAIAQIKPGDNILIYRSKDTSGITAIGAVEDTLRSSNPDEIARHVGSRTVYSFDNIVDFCHKPTLAIRFRYVKGLSLPIRLNELKRKGVIRGAPQSITRLRPEGVEWIRTKLSM
ncbi:MAG: EVE domain-containing protein [Desulfobacteraceae bacterium]|nr:EVE domain-containing protein [Desulfobacteraceae bacterium]